MSTLPDKRNEGRPARLPREQRISEILHVAREVFCERGYEATAVAEIAARLGVVEGTIYKYFETKRELLLKTLANWYDELFGDFSRELAGISGARDRFRYAVWRHLCTIRDYPQLCRLIFSEVRSQPGYRDSELHGMNSRYASLLSGVVADGINSGEFRQGIPPALIRDMVFGGVEHHAWSYLYGHGSIDVDRLADQLTSTLCDGLLNRRDTDTLSHHTERLSALADRLELALQPSSKSHSAGNASPKSKPQSKSKSK